MLEFALSIKPTLLISNAIWITVALVAILLSRNAKPIARSVVLTIAALIVLNTFTMGNPFFWKRAIAVSSPGNIGGQQYAVAHNHYQNMFRPGKTPKFLAVGSSQTAMLFRELGGKREDLQVLAIPGMTLLDTWLFRHDVGASGANVVVLFLSDFDFGRAPQYAASRLDPINLNDSFSLTKTFFNLAPKTDRQQQWLMLKQATLGQWLPAYRFSYLWRSLFDYYFGVNILTASNTNLPGELPSTEALIAASEKSSSAFNKDYFPFYRKLLSEFVQQRAANGQCVVVIDGQYKNQLVKNASLFADTQTLLAALSAENPNMLYLMRNELPTIPETQWVDNNHVDLAFGEFYGQRSLEKINRIMSQPQSGRNFDPSICDG